MLKKLLAAPLVAIALTLAVAPVAGAADPLRLAVTDLQGLEELQRDFGAFQRKLSEVSGYDFEFFPVPSRTAAAEALKARKLDFVLTGPAEYVVIQKRTKAFPVVAFGRPDYFGAIVVMAESGISSPKQLIGKKVAFSDIGSTSGHLAPMQLLADYGVDPRKDVEAIHTTRNIMHEALKRGDIAAIGINYRTWVSLARDKDTSVEPGAFRVIARGPDLPNDILVAGAHVDKAVSEKVKNAIVGNSPALIAAITSAEENDKYVGMKFIGNVTDEDYAYVRAAYATIGYPQYSDFVGN
jgi:phosphonate transport system substrate-binding protein